MAIVRKLKWKKNDPGDQRDRMNSLMGKGSLSQSPVRVRKIRKRSIYHPLLIRVPFCGCFYTQGLGMHESLAAAAAKSLQSCLTLCNPKDGSPLGSSVPGILQARILEWVAISLSNA